MEKLIIIGTGAMSRDVTKFVERYDLYDIVGYACNKEYYAGGIHFNKKIYCVDELAHYFDKSDVQLFVAISELRHLNRDRKATYKQLKEQGWHFATLVSPSATLYTARIGEGCWIMDQVFIGNEAIIGDNTFISERAVIAHYTNIGSHTFIAIESLVLGSTIVGDQCFVGARAVLFNDIKIGDKCIIGATTVIKNNIEKNTVCKIESNIIQKQYTDDVIESKLLPAQEYKSEL